MKFIRRKEINLCNYSFPHRELYYSNKRYRITLQLFYKNLHLTLIEAIKKILSIIRLWELNLTCIVFSIFHKERKYIKNFIL